MLTTQMKKQQPSLEDGDGEPPQPRAVSSLEDRDSKATVHDLSAGAGGVLSHFPHPALTQDPQEREVSSAALETTQIKDKLKKRRMSEGLLTPQRGKTGACTLFCRRQGLSQARELAHILSEEIPAEYAPLQ